MIDNIAMYMNNDINIDIYSDIINLWLFIILSNLWFSGASVLTCVRVLVRVINDIILQWIYIYYDEYIWNFELIVHIFIRFFSILSVYKYNTVFSSISWTKEWTYFFLLITKKSGFETLDPLTRIKGKTEKKKKN